METPCKLAVNFTNSIFGVSYLIQKSCVKGFFQPYRLIVSGSTVLGGSAKARQVPQVKLSKAFSLFCSSTNRILLTNRIVSAYNSLKGYDIITWSRYLSGAPSLATPIQVQPLWLRQSFNN
jgi:hypothetical protein